MQISSLCTDTETQPDNDEARISSQHRGVVA
jgi:hypothetical protein